MKKNRNPVLAVLLLGLTSAPVWPAATFTPLGDLPGGSFHSRAWSVSADGSVVTGASHSASGLEVFRWTSGGGMVGLGDLTGGSFGSDEASVSADGSVVSGIGHSASGEEAFRWTSGGGMVGLGHLPDFTWSEAYSISADGSAIVGGNGTTSGISEAFVWTSDSGMVGLGYLPGGDTVSSAEDVSANGSVVVGVSNSPSGLEAYRWTKDGMVGLGDLPGEPFFSVADGVSDDGLVVVGFGNLDETTGVAEAFRWTREAGMIGLGDLPGGMLSSFAHEANADGSVIVGVGNTSLGDEAFLWTSDGGMRNLRELLIAGGVTGLTDWRLTSARAVSPDGRVIVGYGTNPSGRTEAWLANISEPGDFDLDGSLTALDIELLSAEIRNGGVNPRFDVNGDSLIDQQDRKKWVRELRRTYFGDANVDGEFNSGDLVTVFGAGQYEDAAAKNSTWSTGDWNGDAEFDTSDLVLAFQDGGFEQGPRASVTAVPEPASWTLVGMAFVATLARRRRASTFDASHPASSLLC